jgi:preprotein translocase subunit SecE
MAVSNKDQEKDAMSKTAGPGPDNELDREDLEARQRAQDYHSRQAAARIESPGGFLTIYKSGQGYWTRMGTAGAVAIVLIFTAQFLYQNLRVRWMPDAHEGLRIGIVGTIILGLASLTYWLMNKPTNADFLIATDSEMRKVNWASRKELIGSTKVVILFMFLIGAFLFVVDLIWGVFFWSIGVMKIRPW